MSDGVVKHGQLLDTQLGVVKRYTETMLDYAGADSARVTGSEGNANTEIIPNDRDSAKVKIYDITAIKAAYAAFALAVPDVVNLNFPPVLTALTAAYTKDSSNGTHDETGTVTSSGTTVSVSLGLNGSSQGSAAVITHVIAEITDTWGQNLPVIQYFMYFDGTFTQAQLLTRLATESFANTAVLAWPVFKPKPITILGIGVKVSARAEASASTAFGLSDTRTDSSVSTGRSVSGERNINAQITQIPPTLHANLASSIPASTTQSFHAQAQVALTGSGGPSSSDSGLVSTGTLTAGGLFQTSSLAATSPAALPTSGLYLYSVESQQADFGQVLVRAVVFNFATIA